MITLQKLFGGIGTCFEALLHLGMVVQRYFYVDIDPIARQMATSRMMELIAKFSTIVCNHYMEGQFHFFAL